MSYVEQHDGGYWWPAPASPLDSLVYAFLRGDSPESIAQSFPVLTLEVLARAAADGRVLVSGRDQPTGGLVRALQDEREDLVNADYQGER
jgi:hypothetical protein